MSVTQELREQQVQLYDFDTLAVHGGQRPDPHTGSRAVPIYQTTSFNFKNTEHAVKVVNFEEEAFTYTRVDNPTVDVFEQRIAALERGAAALALASGQAAVSLSLLNIVRPGDEIVSGTSLYGGTYNLFNQTFPELGIKVKFVDASDPESFRRAISERTRAVYAETIGNPKLDILDVETVAKIAHEAGVPLVVDNTIASPYLLRPIDWGADIVVHSATKFIGGHGTTIGGAIVDSGRFDWKNGKFPGITEPQLSYHGLDIADKFGPLAYITRARLRLLRDLGPSPAPINAFLLLLGLETLHLRMRRHVDNASAIAGYLVRHPKVAWVGYPGLEGHPSYQKAKKYLPKGAGSIVTLGIRGGFESTAAFIDNLELFSLLANIGDTKSLVIHPASTTHAQLTEEEQSASGVTPDLIRLSVGIEDSEDLIADIGRALDKVRL